MTKYIKEINGIPENLNPVSLPQNTNTVSNFNRLDDETLRITYGYYPCEETEQPIYDPETQNISSIYEKQENKYVLIWTITDKSQIELDEIADLKKANLKKYASKKKEEIISQGFTIIPSGSPESSIEIQTATTIDIINLLGTVIGAIVKNQINNNSLIPYRGKNKQQHLLENTSVIEIGMGVLNQIQQVYGKAWMAETKIDSGIITNESEIDSEFE